MYCIALLVSFLDPTLKRQEGVWGPTCNWSCIPSHDHTCTSTKVHHMIAELAELTRNQHQSLIECPQTLSSHAWWSLGYGNETDYMHLDSQLAIYFIIKLIYNFLCAINYVCTQSHQTHYWGHPAHAQSWHARNFPATYCFVVHQAQAAYSMHVTSSCFHVQGCIHI